MKKLGVLIHGEDNALVLKGAQALYGVEIGEWMVLYRAVERKPIDDVTYVSVNDRDFPQNARISLFVSMNRNLSADHRTAQTREAFRVALVEARDRPDIAIEVYIFDGKSFQSAALITADPAATV